MKATFTIILCLLSVFSMGHSTAFEKLAEVNKCWLDQKDAPVITSTAASEHEWIRLHLSLVEQTLRQRSAGHLNASQAANRTKALNDLHGYWQAGRFPVNDAYAYRTPIFIDKYDNFCAVGYLVKTSGNEAVSRMIASKTNLAYVKQMHYPELEQWAQDYGFTIDELAWIQPGYPPQRHAAAIGKGVDGEIREMLVDNDILYVGGKFSKADSTIAAHNIAYITESGGVYTWHNMGSGVNGPVHTMVKFDNKLFVAGAFTEAGGNTASGIAYWDGSAWHSLPCTYGTINSLVVFNNELYLAGKFDICAALSNVNFAKWDAGNNRWEQMWGLDGHVNTMQVVGSKIVLGGAFSWQGTVQNVIKWSPAESFKPFTGNIANEVMDFQVYHDTVYAACKRTVTTADSIKLLLTLQQDSWQPLLATFPAMSYVPNGNELSFNSLCVANDRLLVGGNFHFLPMVGHFAHNYMDITPNANGSWFMVDSTVNKLVAYKGSVIAGGKFKRNYSLSSPGAVILNGIARESLTPNSVPGIPAQGEFSLYPNPVNNAGSLTLKNNFGARHIAITDLAGRVIARQVLQAQETQSIRMPELTGGTYMVELANDHGLKVTRKITVQ